MGADNGPPSPPPLFNASDRAQRMPPVETVPAPDSLWGQCRLRWAVQDNSPPQSGSAINHASMSGVS